MNVVLAARDLPRGQEAVQKLRDEGLEVTCERLDVANSQSVKDCARRLATPLHGGGQGLSEKRAGKES
jgi:hypothetical protein